MVVKNKQTPTFSISEDANALAVVQKIKAEHQEDFDVVLHGDNFEWLISSFIDLKTNFSNMKVLYLTDNTNSQTLIDSLIKAGIDGIVFNENISDSEMKEISQKIDNKNTAVSNPDDIKKLHTLRAQVDELDYKLLQTAVERLKIVKQISEIKSGYHIPVFQPERYIETKQTVDQVAKQTQTDKAYLQRLIDALHLGSVISQVK